MIRWKREQRELCHDRHIDQMMRRGIANSIKDRGEIDQCIRRMDRFWGSYIKENVGIQGLEGGLKKDVQWRDSRRDCT